MTYFFFPPKYQSQRLLPSFLYGKLLTMLIVQHHLGVLCNPHLTLNFTSTYSQTKRKAEILWALKCVESDWSANSAKQISNVFVKLFLIAKLQAIFNFGVAPYFRQFLVDEIKSFDFYSIFF